MRKKEILIVDDEPGICKVLSISLADSGYKVHSAQSAESALEICKQLQPPIVITDIKMPGMDGIQLLQEIKRRQPDTEVIMITGHGDIDLAIESLKFEATDFITKPINADALDIALKRAHEKIALKQQLKAHTENLEQLVRQKSRQLIAAERLAAAGETAAGLSHAIKNIASALRGGSFVLEKGIALQDRELLNQGWDLLRGNVEKITKLSLDLLDFSKPAHIQRCWCDPNAPARDIHRLLQVQARRNRVILTLNLDPQIEPLYLDPEAIHRCLLNLVANAIDACAVEAGTTAPGKQVTIRTSKTLSRGVEYVVEDNGIGMGDETRKKLFRMFFTTKGSRGTGLGLLLTHKIVDLHGGKISVDSQEGRGTRFTMRIPGQRVSDGGTPAH